MKIQKALYITIFSSFILLCLGGFFRVHEGVAAMLTGAKDDISEIWVTKMENDANAGDTNISVKDGTGITIGDIIFINDSVNSETRTVLNSLNNVLTIDNLANSYDVSTRSAMVMLLTGITHSISFQATTTANAEKIRFTFSNTAIADGASFQNVQFSGILGVQEAATPNHITNQISYCEFDADGTLLTAATNIMFHLDNVTNPNGTSENSYPIAIEIIDENDDIIDQADIIFSVSSGLVVEARVGAYLQLIIEDDGTKNNTSDSSTGVEISLGYASTTTLNDPIMGYGMDGNKLIVSTNAQKGYNISISDSVNGLVSPGFAGAGRPSGEFDNGIDDISGAPASWVAQGVEAYGYNVGATFDSEGISNNYRPFTNTAVEIMNTPNPVMNDITYITIRVQIANSTPNGQYSDKIVYTIVTNI